MKKKNVSAVVLAGGNSTRMGKNKALLELGNKKMIEVVVDTLRPLVEEIIIVTNHTELQGLLKNVRYVKDCIELQKKSSIVGLYTGLREAKNEYSFVTACDMPLLNIALIKYMIETVGEEDVLLPYFKGFYQPLYSIYRKSCLRQIEEMLEKKDYKIINLFERVNTKKIRETEIIPFDQDLQSFLNVNTYKDYEYIKALYIKRNKQQ